MSHNVLLWAWWLLCIILNVSMFVRLHAVDLQESLAPGWTASFALHTRKKASCINTRRGTANARLQFRNVQAHICKGRCHGAGRGAGDTPGSSHDQAEGTHSVPARSCRSSMSSSASGSSPPSSPSAASSGSELAHLTTDTPRFEL